MRRPCCSATALNCACSAAKRDVPPNSSTEPMSAMRTPFSLSTRANRRSSTPAMRTMSGATAALTSLLCSVTSSLPLGSSSGVMSQRHASCVKHTSFTRRSSPCTRAAPNTSRNVRPPLIATYCWSASCSTSTSRSAPPTVPSASSASTCTAMRPAAFTSTRINAADTPVTPAPYTTTSSLCGPLVGRCSAAKSMAAAPNSSITRATRRPPSSNAVCNASRRNAEKYDGAVITASDTSLISAA
mmetsp:Transcript_4597/g.7421  ORF Transcript_4597/g.7421 Transcript_4597/m.7421 type:complete len:243 (+) Transcript_4597:748-1476(+)